MTFAELLALWRPIDLAAAIDINYNIARTLVVRGKANPRYWRALAAAYNKRYPRRRPLTVEDLLDMWVEAEDRAEPETRTEEARRHQADKELKAAERERERREAMRVERIRLRRLAAEQRRNTRSG
jgi:hypothetical protein